jgi:carboxyl-terminal processing protease
MFEPDTPCSPSCHLAGLVILAILLSGSIFSRPSMALSARPAAPLTEIKAIITDKALNPVPEKKINELSMKDLSTGLRSIDPHARYIPPAPAAKKFSSDLRIGLELFLYKSRIWVRPEPDGPAGKAGVPEVGELQRINDTSVADNLEQASTLIDAAIAGNEVVLDIHQTTENSVGKFTIRPASSPKKTVTSRTIGNYIFIRVTDFVTRETAPFFSALYSTLAKSNSRIVIDLRGCPGGDIFEALEIAGMFVPPGLPLLTTYDRAGKLHSYTSPKGEKLRPPAALLIDKSTASAAEVLAGILKKQGLTPLIGEQSYGKCTSQTIFNLSNGGQLWLTTLAIHFSDDTPCSQTGVQPDLIYPDIAIARLSNIKSRIDKD